MHFFFLVLFLFGQMSAITANSSIKSFLRRASLSLSQLSSNSNNICMVLGNEAADDDSSHGVTVAKTDETLG